jgi:hypothetical protein
MDLHHFRYKPRQSCAEEDVEIASNHQGLISSSNSERQSESLVQKVVCPFGLEIDEDLYLHQLQPVS